VFATSAIARDKAITLGACRNGVAASREQIWRLMAQCNRPRSVKVSGFCSNFHQKFWCGHSVSNVAWASQEDYFPHRTQQPHPAQQPHLFCRPAISTQWKQRLYKTSI